jgi:hypothetical protein
MTPLLTIQVTLPHGTRATVLHNSTPATLENQAGNINNDTETAYNRPLPAHMRAMKARGGGEGTRDAKCTRLVEWV